MKFRRFIAGLAAFSMVFGIAVSENAVLSETFNDFTVNAQTASESGKFVISKQIISAEEAYNDTICVSMELTDNIINSGSFGLVYDDRLSLRKVAMGSGLTEVNDDGGFCCFVPNRDAGAFAFASTGSKKSDGASGEIAKFYFEIIDTSGSNVYKVSAVNYDDIIKCDSDCNEIVIDPEFETGGIIIPDMKNDPDYVPTYIQSSIEKAHDGDDKAYSTADRDESLDLSGAYSMLCNIGEVKEDDGISAYGAMMVLRDVVNLHEFETVMEKVTADVDMSGSITSRDALHILQYFVNVRSSFNGACSARVWLDDSGNEIAGSREYFRYYLNDLYEGPSEEEGIDVTYIMDASVKGIPEISLKDDVIYYETEAPESTTEDTTVTDKPSYDKSYARFEFGSKTITMDEANDEITVSFNLVNDTVINATAFNFTYDDDLTLTKFELGQGIIDVINDGGKSGSAGNQETGQFALAVAPGKTLDGVSGEIIKLTFKINNPEKGRMYVIDAANFNPVVQETEKGEKYELAPSFGSGYIMIEDDGAAETTEETYYETTVTTEETEETTTNEGINTGVSDAVKPSYDTEKAVFELSSQYVSMEEMSGNIVVSLNLVNDTVINTGAFRIDYDEGLTLMKIRQGSGITAMLEDDGIISFVPNKDQNLFYIAAAPGNTLDGVSGEIAQFMFRIDAPDAGAGKMYRISVENIEPIVQEVEMGSKYVLEPSFSDGYISIVNEATETMPPTEETTETTVPTETTEEEFDVSGTPAVTTEPEFTGVSDESSAEAAPNDTENAGGSEEGDLPQTGNNKPKDLAAAASAFLMTVAGAFAMLKSGKADRKIK